MAATTSAEWSNRLKNLDDLYQRDAFAECVQETRSLLKEPLLPCLYAVKCHTMLGNAIPEWHERDRHKKIATQLWDAFESYWPEQLTSEACVIEQSLYELTTFLSGCDPSRPVKKESGPQAHTQNTAENSQRNSGQEQYHSDSTIRQSIEPPGHDFVLYSEPSQSSAPYPASLIHNRPSTPPCAFTSPPSHKYDSPIPSSSAQLSAPGAPRITNLKSPLRTPSPLF